MGNTSKSTLPARLVALDLTDAGLMRFLHVYAKMASMGCTAKTKDVQIGMVIWNAADTDSARVGNVFATMGMVLQRV